LGWIRVSGSAFTSYKLTQKKKDFIFMFAKDHNMKYIWVDEIDDGLNSRGKLVGEEPEKLYEQYKNQFARSPVWNKKAFTVPEDQDCPNDMTRTNDGYCQEDDIGSLEDNTLQEIIEKCQ
jgi:hypothetical protein